MRLPFRRRPEAEGLRYQLSALAFETKLIRLQRSLSRKYSADQPRVPAGQSDGGQWVSGGGDGSGGGSLGGQATWASLGGNSGDAGPETTRERTVTEDGSQVLSLRIRAGRGEWDEQHTVIAADGESRIFETSGATQTIRDGQSGEVLSRSTLTPLGVAPEATVQPAFAPALPLVATTTIEAAALLFTVLSARKDGFGTVLGMAAQGYDFDPSNKSALPIPWVGRLSKDALSQYCPRSEEVQIETDKEASRISQRLPFLTPQQKGNVLHFSLARHFSRSIYPDMKAELSLDGSENPASYGTKGSVRLDLYEQTPQRTVCIYDYKTGKEGLSASRALILAQVARLYYPHATAIVIIQVRPQLSLK